MMITEGEIILVLIVLVVAASLFLDIRGVLRRLSDFRWRAKIKKEEDYNVLATMLKNMESSGLIKLKSGEDENPTIKMKRQAKEQHRITSNKAA